MVCTNIVLVLFLSFCAYLCDRRSGIIPNALIMMGYAAGFIYAICEKGPPGIIGAIISAVWPILLLFVLFRIRALGAGDIKLFSVISIFLNYKEMLAVIYLSFVAGAIVGIIRLMRTGQTLAHLKNFQSYLIRVAYEKKLYSYETVNTKIGILHFAGCIFASVLMLYLWEVLRLNGLF